MTTIATDAVAVIVAAVIAVVLALAGVVGCR